MRITNLTLSNYRAFSKPIRFEFSKNLTVIAGVNGRGKTTIIEGLALLLSRLLPLISPARSGYRRMQPLDVHSGAEMAEISANVICAKFPINFKLQYSTSTGKLSNTRLASGLRKEIANAYGNPNRSDDQAPLVVYYTTDRAGYRFPKAMPKVAAIRQGMAYNGALTNRTIDYKSFIARYRVADAHRKDVSDFEIKHYLGDNAIKAINKTIKIFLDGFGDLEVRENPIRLLVNKNGKQLDIRQLSDGERSFIALICDLGRRLAIANPDLKNPLEGAGVVLIDEIELHLHPKWQLEVTEKLRKIFPNIQFIVTTHSPFVIQTARQGEILLLDKELAVDPYGKSLEEVSRYVMDVKDTEYSPRIKQMKEVAREYFKLSNEARHANNRRRNEIQKELIKLLAPFSDNPAYIALLESKGIIEPEEK
jgi:predicted ATP-binding protein involved in virulence